MSVIEDPTPGELEAMWAALFGGPPPVSGPSSLLIRVMVAHLPAAPPYTPSPVEAEPEDGLGE